MKEEEISAGTEKSSKEFAAKIEHIKETKKTNSVEKKSFFRRGMIYNTNFFSKMKKTILSLHFEH